jgi:hypothetical protein
MEIAELISQALDETTPQSAEVLKSRLRIERTQSALRDARKRLEVAREALAEGVSDKESVERAEAALSDAGAVADQVESSYRFLAETLLRYLGASQVMRREFDDYLAIHSNDAPTFGCVSLGGFWDGYGSVIDPLGRNSAWLGCSSGRAIANDWMAVSGDLARAFRVFENSLEETSPRASTDTLDALNDRGQPSLSE